MNVSENEARRASNLIWNAARDYGFEPTVRVYDQEGRAELYWNSIVGAVHRHFDDQKLQELLDSFTGSKEQNLYENLTWLALENAAFQREQPDRPALTYLREEYARRAVKMVGVRLAEILEVAHFRRVLGQDPGVTGEDRKLLDALEVGPDLDTDALIAHLQAVFAARFGYRPADPETRRKKKKRFWLSRRRKGRQEMAHVRGFAFGFGVYSSGGGTDTQRQGGELKLAEGQTPEGLQRYIRDYFGPPCCTEKELQDMERDYCTGNHKNCHLYMTRGLSADRTLPKGYAGIQKRENIQRTQKNRAFYQEHLTRNQMIINRLTSRLRSSLLTQTDTSEVRANAGNLVGGRIWRGLCLGDEKLFLRSERGDPGNLSVDILLDASTSQLRRQETIVTQCYIIAESLTRCGLPVRVFSFSSMSGYTVLTVFRDYQEKNGNDNIFNYYPSGCNRDGLAIRMAAGQMAKTNYDHKLLIILSDVKPNGVVQVETSKGIFQAYADQVGVDDTAAEVHRAGMDGVSVVCVFTGNDEDLPAARKVYGHNLARIRSLDQFADAVAKVILMQIKNL